MILFLSSSFYLSLTVMHFGNDIQTFFINWEICALICGNCKSNSRILMNLSNNFNKKNLQGFYYLNVPWLDHIDDDLKSDKMNMIKILKMYVSSNVRTSNRFMKLLIPMVKIYVQTFGKRNGNERREDQRQRDRLLNLRSVLFSVFRASGCPEKRNWDFSAFDWVISTYKHILYSRRTVMPPKEQICSKFDNTQSFPSFPSPQP